MDSIGDYLAEIGRHNLLSPEEEIDLGKKIQEGLLLEGLQNPSRAQKSTLKRAQKAKEKMIVCNLRLVVNVATLYSRRNPEHEIQDLIQEGSIGLSRAVERFDPTRGYKFSTFAYWWIRQGITRYISEYQGAIRVPSHVQELISKMKKGQEEHIKLYGKAMEEKELANELNVNYDILRSARRAACCVSLDGMNGKDDNIPILWSIPDENQNPWEHVENSETTELAAKMLALLSDRDRNIVKLHLVEGYEFKTIAFMLGMTSKGSAHYFHTKAIKKLRDSAQTLQQELVLS